MEMLIKSQNGELTIMGRVVSIGRRSAIETIGDKLSAAIEEKQITTEELIKEIGNSYRDNIVRILNNEEIPTKKMIDKLCKYFNKEENYFADLELNNVIITDNNIVIGRYSTNNEALEIKKAIDEIIFENYKNNKPIVIEMPASKEA